MILTFPELLTLHLIVHHLDNEGEPPSWRRLTDLFNQWYDREQPGLSFVSSPIGGMRTLEIYITNLRGAGLLTAESKLTPTPLGRSLVQALNSNYQKWPLRLPIEDGQYDLDAAEYK